MELSVSYPQTVVDRRERRPQAVELQRSGDDYTRQQQTGAGSVAPYRDLKIGLKGLKKSGEST